MGPSFSVLLVVLLLLTCAAMALPAERVVYTVFADSLPPVKETSSLFVSHLYVSCVDTVTKIPDWVAYKVHPATFYSGNVLERNWKSPRPDVLLEAADYKGSGYDMGHLAALGHFKASPYASEVNWMACVAPQRPGLNRGPWKALEESIRTLSMQAGEVSVVVGSLYESQMPPLPNADETHTVPSHYWLYERVGDKTYYYVFPQDAPENAPYSQFRVDPAEFTKRTGWKPQ